MKCSLAALAAAFLLLPATLYAQDSNEEWLDDCRDNWGHSGSRARHCEIRELGMKPSRGPLSVQPGMNGGVEIVGWDRDSIAITARIQVNARTQDDAEAIAREIKIEAAGNVVRVSGARSSSGRNQHWGGVMFIVMVPRKTDLTLSTDNGPLSVSDVTGTMDLETQNGPLSLSGVGGDVRATAQNGPLSVDLMGTKWEGAGLDARTQNGPADLRIPDNYNAKIEFGTVNGPMDVGFPMTVTISGRVKDRISTTLGSGGPPIKVVTTNGPMTVRRGGI